MSVKLLLFKLCFSNEIKYALTYLVSDKIVLSILFLSFLYCSALFVSYYLNFCATKSLNKNIYQLFLSVVKKVFGVLLLKFVFVFYCCLNQLVYAFRVKKKSIIKSKDFKYKTWHKRKKSC